MPKAVYFDKWIYFQLWHTAGQQRFLKLGKLHTAYGQQAHSYQGRQQNACFNMKPFNCFLSTEKMDRILYKLL